MQCKGIDYEKHRAVSKGTATTCTNGGRQLMGAIVTLNHGTGFSLSNMTRKRLRLPNRIQKVLSSFVLIFLFHDVAVDSFQITSKRQKFPILSAVKFRSPLLDYGYLPTVEQHERGELETKPLLLYLPGFDGTFLSAFIQYPELDTIFDVRCMEVPTSDRSTYDDLKSLVLSYIGDVNDSRDIYLAGESFGGILACDVATAVNDRLSGLILINPATSYDRSELFKRGPPLTRLPSWQYWFRVADLLPLFSDQYSIQQILFCIQGKALPSVIDNEVREAFLGRVAASLPSVIPVMTQDLLRWRLEEWLDTGCERIKGQLHEIGSLATLIVCGEDDNTLPSMEEGERLRGEMKNATVYCVVGSGHASTCFCRCDLAATIRKHFIGLQEGEGRTAMKEVAKSGEGSMFGMEPRYDGKSVGLSPSLYWSDLYYKAPMPQVNAT